MFELDGPYLTEERAKTYLWEKMKQGANLSSADQAEIQKSPRILTIKNRL